MASRGRPTCESTLLCFTALLLICHSEASARRPNKSNAAASINTAFERSDSDAAAAAAAAAARDDKVALSLYYESLCPYCANFIVNQLVKIFQTDLISIVNIRLVPWGNAVIASNGSWICQHGSDECLLNMVEACAINAWPNPEIHFRLIHCLESLRLKKSKKKWESCFGYLGLDDARIKNCFKSGLAIKLEQGYADETAHLNPPHRFVPWVLVNNRPLQEDYQNYVAYICKVYKGNEVPQACRSNVVRSSFVSATVSFVGVSIMNSTSSVSVAQPEQAEKIWPRH